MLGDLSSLLYGDFLQLFQKFLTANSSKLSNMACSHLAELLQKRRNKKVLVVLQGLSK
jgi:hypothetical protein